MLCNPLLIIVMNTVYFIQFMCYCNFVIKMLYILSRVKTCEQNVKPVKSEFPLWIINATSIQFDSQDKDELAMCSYRKYVVMDTTREMDHHLDCTRGLVFTMHELQLLRQEEHQARDDQSGAVQRSEWLYLGDIHTETARRIYHRPKAYQAPLRKYDTESQVRAI